MLPACRGRCGGLGWLLGRLLLSPSGRACRLLRGCGGLLLGRLTPCRCAALYRGRLCGWLALRCAPCWRGGGLLRLLGRLLRCEACRGLGGLRCGLTVPGLARFVALNVEHLLNFGVLGIVLLRPNFDNKRNVVKLRRILQHKHAGNVANCGKLTMCNFYRLLV